MSNSFFYRFIKNACFLFFLIISFFNGNSQQIQKGESRNQEILDEYLQELFRDIEDGVEAQIVRNGDKAVLRTNSEKMNLNTYDFNSNKDYVIQVFNLIQVIDEINDNLEFINSISRNEFYNSFDECGCRGALMHIIKLYRKNWNNLKISIDRMELPETNFDAEINRKIKSLLNITKKKKAVVDEELIHIKINPDILDELKDYFKNGAVPSNADTFLELSKLIGSLKLELTYFISIVKLYN